MLRVGLTGSIAVGKSFVLECFRELGCHTLDADKTARDVVEPGTEGLELVVEEFGSDILQADGTLDRKKLGAIVFADEAKRKILNSIIHPRVFIKQNEWLVECEQRDPNGVAIVDAALMIESGGYKRFDKLIVVWCEDSVQLERLIKRDGLNPADAEKRIAAQMSQDEKRSFADFEIDTSNGFDDTRSQVEETFLALKHLNE
jgi:dephospho-CoA kinase